MGAETPNQVAAAAQAVFLSYASQDADAARRICDALRAEGIEIWFDQSELRGGDVWDQKIRREIRDCALFIPVISTNTTSRREGYFRLEWDLADQRSHRIARDQAFIVPVSVDATPGAGTDVPESFHRVQWTRLPAGDTPPEFVARIKRLLSPEPAAAAQFPAGAPGAPPSPRTISRPPPLTRALPGAVAVLVIAALAYLIIDKPWISKPAAPAASSNATSSPGARPAAFNPPPHSIAVLPFVNMSGDKEQEYFSDGLTEELLNSLAEITELQVAARTSAFSFKGTNTDISTIARKLNVGTVLEGSVRRSGNTVRVTTQLINAVTGFHLWSHTYDRDLGDVLKLETEIAGAVASALKVSLLGDVAMKIELGGTRNPAAFDAYLRASRAYQTVHDAKDLDDAIAAFTEAVRLDPDYALALARRAFALGVRAEEFASGPAIREGFDNARTDARRAITLAPDLAEGHQALARFFEMGSLDFAQAISEYDRAVSLAPGNAWVLSTYGRFTVYMGRTEAGVTAGRHAVVLDPLNPLTHDRLGIALYFARRYAESVGAFNDALTLDPGNTESLGFRGLAYMQLGDFQQARASCEANLNNWLTQFCLALTYNKLGRHAAAETALAKLRGTRSDGQPYLHSVVYAQWGNTRRSLDSLETALQLRNSWLKWLKTDPLMDPLRKEPRFQAVERELKFPN